MSGVSKVWQSALSATRKLPGSGAVQKIFEKTKAKVDDDMDVSKLAKLTEADKDVNQLNVYAPVEMAPEELQKLCNISRLNEKHRHLVNGQAYFVPELAYTKSLLYQRKLYARYGAATNIDPRKLWPTESELETTKELERLRYPTTVEDIFKRVADIKAKEAEEEAVMRARDADIAAKIPTMEAMKEKIYTDAVKLEEQLNIAEEKRNKRIEQVRSFFQYTLDVKDPRFKEKMLEMIQSEKDAHLKKSKEAKKLKREEQKAKADAEKAAAIKARREAKAKAEAESSDDE